MRGTDILDTNTLERENMLKVRSIGLVVLALACMARTVAAQSDEDPMLALRAEGYLGGAVVEPDGPVDDQSSFTGGGTGSLALVRGLAHFQADIFGDSQDSDPEFSNVGVAGHFGVADPEVGALAFTLGYNRLDLGRSEDDLVRVGGEVEAYLSSVTLGMQGGLFGTSSSVDDFYYLRGILRFYPTDNLKLEAALGYADTGDDLAHARAQIEFRPESWWASFFVRWESAYSDSLDQHAAVIGLKFMRDGGRTLEASDRKYFRDACGGLLLGARTC